MTSRWNPRGTLDFEQFAAYVRKDNDYLRETRRMEARLEPIRAVIRTQPQPDLRRLMGVAQ